MIETRAETLLVELLTEELPPRSLRALGAAFATGIANGLAQRGLAGEGNTATAYATPRRLAVTVSHVLPKAVGQRFKQKVLPLSIAYDAGGKPTAALTKKLAALGATIHRVS